MLKLRWPICAIFKSGKLFYIKPKWQFYRQSDRKKKKLWQMKLLKPLNFIIRRRRKVKTVYVKYALRIKKYILYIRKNILCNLNAKIKKGSHLMTDWSNNDKRKTHQKWTYLALEHFLLHKESSMNFFLDDIR